MSELAQMTSPELLVLHSAISDELRRRGIVRSSNNPVGDLAEYMFCKAFGWEQAANSARDADAIDAEGHLYQIKGRRLTARNNSRQLGAMRNLPACGFHTLAAILFNEKYEVHKAALIPHSTVLETAVHVEHTNSWKFMLKDAIWTIDGVRDVTADLRSVSLD